MPRKNETEKAVTPRVIMNPWTQRAIDYDSISDFSSERQQPGKFCPVTGNPMDETALSKWHPGMATDALNNSLRETAAANIEKINRALSALE